MIKKILFTILLVNLSLLHAENAFQAKLIDIKIFKGDLGKGNYNSCKLFLILETYELSNTTLNGIVISHSTNNNAPVLRKKEYKQAKTNYITYPYCVSNKSYQANINTRFMNSQGQQSNNLHFKVDTKGLKLYEANQYPNHIKIK